MAQVFGSCVDSVALQCVEFIHNLGDVCCTCRSVRRSLDLANIWQVRCARRGLTLSGNNSGSVVIKQIDWQYVANSLLRRFTVIAMPFTPASLLSLARCAEFVPRAIEGEASFIIQLREDTPNPSSKDEILYIRTYSHEVPMEFDGDEYRVEFEQATFADEEDVTLTAWLRWEPKRQPPYEGFSGFPKSESSTKNGSFAAVRARIHCLFLDPYPQLTEVSSDGDAVFRAAFGAIPQHIFQGDGTGWDAKMASNFGRAWSNNPASRPIFVFVHLGSYRNHAAFNRIIDAGPALCLSDVFEEEEALDQAPALSVC